MDRFTENLGEIAIDVALFLMAVSFAVVLVRNLYSMGLLLIAARAFATRIQPAKNVSELWTRYSDLLPAVSVIAPCYNEELSIQESARALLSLQYPQHEVILVNDGSTDATLAKLIEEFDLQPVEPEPFAQLHKTKIRGCYASEAIPNLLVIDKENGRKADAANAGIGFSGSPLVCVIDADSIIEPDGLLRATEPFLDDDGSLVAVGGAIRIANGSVIHGGHLSEIRLPRRWIERFQLVEYLRAFLTARIANAHLDMLMIISGAFGIFRRDVLVEIGGYRHDTVGEDLELVTRLHRHMREKDIRYRIGFVPEVVCWTEAPHERTGLSNQRARWEQGALETLVEHRRMLFNPRYGRIGMFALPVFFVEDVLGPPMELLGYVLMPILLLLGIVSLEVCLSFLALTFIFGTALSLGTLILEEVQLRRTPSAADLLRIGIAAVIENFGYRQLNIYYRLRGMVRFLKKDDSWAAVPRAGFGGKPAS